MSGYLPEHLWHAATTDESQPVTGVVIEPDRDRLPQGMVESMTEYDWVELPSELRDSLRQWCEALRVWANGEGRR